MTTRWMSASQQALARELEENGSELRRLLAGVADRPALWRYAKGLRRPSSTKAAAIERLTDGRVLASGWATAKELRCSGA